MRYLKAIEGRDDISRFVIHLTRDYNNQAAIENLISILRTKKIEARNPHCLFKYEFQKLDFSEKLEKKFDVVCFTEAPLMQLANLTKLIPGRQIELKSYGLIFWKEELLKIGANPAIYISSYEGSLRNYLLKIFRQQFKEIKRFNTLKIEEKKYHNEIIKYYSLINIISDKHDFSWEREWRYIGDFKFKYSDVVAIIAEEPEEFAKRIEIISKKRGYKSISCIPIINPNWNIEKILEEFSIKIWED